MTDLQTTSAITIICIAFARCVEWLAKVILNKYEHPPEPVRNGNTAGKVGQLTPEDLEGRLQGLHQQSEERLMRDMRALLESRTLQIVRDVTEPIVAEIRGLRDDLAQREERRARRR